MWDKWTFIAAAAGITCRMRAALGDIIEAGAGNLPVRIYDECARIAADAGYPPHRPVLEQSLQTLSAPRSPLTASMLRDIESRGRTEADHVLGDLLHRRRSSGEPAALLELAYQHVKSYEARRRRELGEPR
jgi:2-dehydropantoate 2-reductase